MSDHFPASCLGLPLAVDLPGEVLVVADVQVDCRVAGRVGSPVSGQVPGLGGCRGRWRSDRCRRSLRCRCGRRELRDELGGECVLGSQGHDLLELTHGRVGVPCGQVVVSQHETAGRRFRIRGNERLQIAELPRCRRRCSGRDPPSSASPSQVRLRARRRVAPRRGRTSRPRTGPVPGTREASRRSEGPRAPHR